MKKTLALLLALVMLCCCAAGCGSSKDDTVMTVNGIEVSFDEYMAWLSTAVTEIQELYSSTGTAIDWDAGFIYDASTTNAEWCIKRTEENLTKIHAVESKAAEMEITLTDEQKQALEDEFAELRKNYAVGTDSEESLKDFLAGYSFTEESYRTQRTLNYIYTNVFAEIYGEQGEKLDDALVLEYAEKNDYVSSAHILLLTSRDVTDDEGNTTSEELSDSEKAEKLAKATELAEELQAITDDTERWARFKELMNEYSEDTGLESFPDGYCFTSGTMVEIYDTTSRELEEYQVSDPVESDFGYHVIIRLPISPDAVTQTFNSYYQQVTLPLSYLAAPEHYENDVNGWAKEADVKFTSLYEKVDFAHFISDDGYSFISYADYKADEEKK